METITLTKKIIPRILIKDGKVYAIKFKKFEENFTINEIDIHLDENKKIKEVQIKNAFHPNLAITSSEWEKTETFKSTPKNSKFCHIMGVTGEPFDSKAEYMLTNLLSVHNNDIKTWYEIPEEFYATYQCG